jgi:hypothetical protein
MKTIPSKRFNVQTCGSFHRGEKQHEWMGKYDISFLRGNGRILVTRKTNPTRYLKKWIGHCDDRHLSTPYSQDWRSQRIRTKIFYYVMNLADNCEGKYSNRKKWKVLMSKWWARTARFPWSNNDL